MQDFVTLRALRSSSPNSALDDCNFVLLTRGHKKSEEIRLKPSASLLHLFTFSVPLAFSDFLV